MSGKSAAVAELAVRLDEWFATASGAAVLAAERALLAPWARRRWGPYVLQLSCGMTPIMPGANPDSEPLRFAPGRDASHRYPVADIEELPLATESMDMVIIHHGLDFTQDVHRLLREAARVLRPGGSLFVIGFNPVGLWGLRRLCGRRSRLPWQGRFLSPRRVCDWLRLLKLTPKATAYGAHFPPGQWGGLLGSRAGWETLGSRLGSPLGGVYVISCVKQLATITPVMPRWQPLRPLPVAVAAARKLHARGLAAATAMPEAGEPERDSARW